MRPPVAAIEAGSAALPGRLPGSRRDQLPGRTSNAAGRRGSQPSGRL